MCLVELDFAKEENLKFGIYSLVRSKTQEFSIEELVQDIRAYQQLDEERLTKQICFLLERWVEAGVVREYLDTYSLAVA